MELPGSEFTGMIVSSENRTNKSTQNYDGFGADKSMAAPVDYNSEVDKSVAPPVDYDYEVEESVEHVGYDISGVEQFLAPVDYNVSELVFRDISQNDRDVLMAGFGAAAPSGSPPKVCNNKGNPHGGGGGAHNRSHDSIESQRTIIEADDFSSYLAQDDDEEVDDFRDEDIDFDVNEEEDGGVDISLLMKGRNNPYMLDFTAGLHADGDVEDDDGYENADDTLSDHEGDDQPETTARTNTDRRINSWIRHNESIQSQSRGKEEAEDEELESPPRNLREEINNNIGKFSRILPALGTGHAPPDSAIPSSLGHPGYIPNSETVSPEMLNYSRQNSFTPPSSPGSLKPHTPKMSQQVYQKPVPESLMPAKFEPDSQSSPILRRAHQETAFRHDWNQSFTGQQESSFMYPASGVTKPHVASSSHQNNGTMSPSGNMSPHLQSYTFETPFGRSAFFSSSLENLSSAGRADCTLNKSPHAGDVPRSSSLQGSALLRGTSLPNIADVGVGVYPELCKNCGFSRNDYLFKIRLLQTQLEKTEKELKKKEKQWAADLGELRKDNDRQQKVIAQSLTLGPEARIEATMQHEITRLTSENLDLRESIDKQTDQIRKLKKMLKVYARKLKDGEAAEIAAELENEERAANSDAIATVIHRERSYMGMLEYKKEDEAALIKNLVLDLKPKLASGLIPGLPAYILFMCVRHTDYINDDEKVKSLLTATINGIRKVVKRHSDDLERITLWLANTCRLLHTLKQYSGEKQFQIENTAKQNEQSLRNFDLSEYRQVFSDLAVWNYQALIKLMEELIQPNIVPAILEHEAIAGLTASKPSGLRGRSSSNAREMEDGKDSQHSLDVLMRTLNSYMKIVKQHAVDPELIKQIFRQLFYFLCAGALNNLLLRKDMCNWSKGMQIRYNLSHLEQWLRDNTLHDFGAQAALEPIIQASQLLQARKTDSDVDTICEMCSKLTPAQIVKILNIYTPVDEFEERVPIPFIRKIQAKLKEREEQGTGSSTLLMDTKYSFPVTFPFNPSSVALETIAVPDQLHLGFLIRH